jgi:dTDP-4-dehydrorhamnose reductase
MRVLILGASGMLGHKLYQTCATRFDTVGTVRSSSSPVRELDVDARIVDEIAATNLSGIEAILADVRPDAVINCIGVVKQDAAAKDPVASIEVNALLPHKLARRCAAVGARLIHLSTDCVFSGRKGRYTETDFADAEDLYGRTKLLGEAAGDGCLTIRTSMIGRELVGQHGLLEWFLSKDGGRVRGFRRAVFSGLTTSVLSELICDIVDDHPRLSGVWHVAAEPINKYDLLYLFRSAYGLSVEIEPDEAMVCDRSLDGSRFRAATGFVAPPWETMIESMAADPTPYAELRRIRATR